ncbi:MAG TPA: hypothetical protein VKA06_08605, partial [Spirochaetia bacterium]|nr:hypothetical protein [Spirochaetia bacterium]
GVLGLTIVFSALNTPSMETRYQEQIGETISRVNGLDLSRPDDRQTVDEIAELDEALLLVQSNGQTVYSRFETAYYDRFFGPTDFGFAEREGVRIFFDLRPVNQEQARANLLYFGIIILLIAAFLFYYSPHFALTVSDPLHVMRRGMNEKGYNLEVKIPSLYRDDEVYRLAKLHNEVYLPLKDRSGSGTEGEILDLKMDDIRDMLNE